MEKKTIGGFIAALRKASGMTQRDLADRLNVSDKTVSRWERDDGAPDLSLIPVIAEIFGVTCDELLRGERRSPSQLDATSDEDATSAKGERERRRLIKSALSRYKIRTYISMGVCAAGLLTALICNFAFLRALLGFYLGAAFLVASVVCQVVFINLALTSVEDSGLSQRELSDFRRGVYRGAKLDFGLTAAVFGFTAPLLTAMDTNMGITSGMTLMGFVFAGLALAVFGTACYFLTSLFIKSGAFILNDEETSVYRRNHRLLGRCAIVLAAVLVLTVVADSTFTDGIQFFRKGTVFNDYESFKDFMEQDVEYYGSSYITPAPPAESVDGPSCEDEEIVSHITDSDGNVVCEYVWRNKSVSLISYGENTLPITVYTHEGDNLAFEKRDLLDRAFYVLYCLEIAAAAVVYLRRRAWR